MRKGIIILSVAVMIASLPFVTAGYRTDFHPIENERSIADKDICISGNINCPTKPFIKGHEEQFSVTVNNTGDEEISATVEFQLWDRIEKEWEFFAGSICTIPSNQIKETNADDVKIRWPGCWCQEPQSPQDPLSPLWPGRFRPQEIRAELYIDDELVDTQENRFFMGFFIF